MAKGPRHVHSMLDDASQLSSRTGPKGMLSRLFGILATPAQPETPAEAAERREAERAAAKVEMARAQAAADSELPKLAAVEEKARLHLERLTPAFQEATRAYDLARAAHSRRAHDLAYARELQARRVLVNAEPLIAEFMDGLAEALQVRVEIHNEERNGEFDHRVGKVVAEVWSNAPSAEARRLAILAAFRDAEALKTDPDQSNLRERFAAILEALPDATVMVKVYEPPAFEPPQRYQTREEEIRDLHRAARHWTPQEDSGAS